MNRPLNEKEAEEVLGRVAQLGMAQTQLVEGLYAASAEATNGRVSAALQALATEISRGKSLDAALADPHLQLPRHVRGLVAAAVRTGSLGATLDELLEHHRSLRSLIWSVWGALAYPLSVLCFATLILGFFLIWIVPSFDRMYVEFELELPAVTQSLIQLSRQFVAVWTGVGVWTLLVVFLLIILVPYLAISGRGGATLQRILEMAPIMGPLWSWSGAAGYLRMLALLLENNVPLPDALNMAADGVRKADLRIAGVWLSEGVAGGQNLSDLVESSHCLPASSVPVLRWGERMGLMSDAAKTLSDIFADRVRIRTTWLRSALPPIIYLTIVLMIGFAIIGLFMPLVSLIQGLS